MLGIFLDIESTGLNYYQNRVIEIAFKFIDLYTGEELFSYQTLVKQPMSVWEKRDMDSMEINGIAYEEVLNGKQEEAVTAEIIQAFLKFKIQRGSCHFICQNPACDRIFFSQLVPIMIQETYKWPYHWLDMASMYWAFEATKHIKAGIPFPNELSVSKNAIGKTYNVPKEELPHRAMNGVNHLIRCYEAMIGFRK